MSAVPINSFNRLNPELQEVLNLIREKRAFNPAEFIKVRCSEFLRYIDKFIRIFINLIDIIIH